MGIHLHYDGAFGLLLPLFFRLLRQLHLFKAIRPRGDGFDRPLEREISVLAITVAFKKKAAQGSLSLYRKKDDRIRIGSLSS